MSERIAKLNAGADESIFQPRTWYWALPVLAMLALLFFRLSDVAGIHRDEAAFGLFAEQIQDGLRPVRGFFNVYTAPIHSYIIAFFFSVFGPTIWSLRLNGVLTNLIAVWFYVDLVRRFFPAQALWTLWFLVTLPAFVVMARIAGENYALNPFFLFGGIWFYYVAGISAKSKWGSRIGYGLSGLFLYLAVWNHIITLPTLIAVGWTYIWYQRRHLKKIATSLPWLLPGILLAAVPKGYGVLVLGDDWLPRSTGLGLAPVSDAVWNLIYTIGGDALYIRACGEILISLNWFLPFCLIASAAVLLQPQMPDSQKRAYGHVAVCFCISFLGSWLITPTNLIGSRIWWLPLWFLPLLLALALPSTAKFLRVVIGSLIIAANVMSLGVNYFYNFLQDGGIPRGQVYVGGRVDNSWDFIDLRPLVAKLKNYNDAPIYIEDFNNQRLAFLLPKNSRGRARTVADLRKGPAAPVNSLAAFYKREGRALPSAARVGQSYLVKNPQLSTRHFEVYEIKKTNSPN